VVQQPPVWIALAAGMALAGGPRGRRAALRGTVCYSTAAIVANVLIKPFVSRSRPPGSGRGRPGPVTSSFPSGHAATDLAFTLGVAQEIPALFVPLAVGTSAAHWSLVRSRGHYPSDVFVGGVVGIGVALAAWKLWPPTRAAGEERDEPSSGDVLASGLVGPAAPITASEVEQPVTSGNGIREGA
jgi:membrane-associated phospholipid phosphatase